MKIKNILPRHKYRIIFYLPYELYVLSTQNGSVKDTVKREFAKNIMGEYAVSIRVKRIAGVLFEIAVKVKEYPAYQKLKEALAGYNELLPPWSAFPGMFQGAPRWNQGHEENYCWNHWIPFWKSMSECEKNAYCAKHNAPCEWADWLNENGEVCFANVRAGVSVITWDG